MGSQLSAIARWTASMVLMIGVNSTATGETWPSVEKIEVVGNEHIPAGAIKAQMKTKENRWFTLLRRRRLEREVLVLDQVRIKAFYRQHGFLDPQVESHLFFSEDSSWVTVEVRVMEGVQTTIGGIEFSQNLLFSDKRLLREISSTAGSPLSPASLDKDRREIEYLYADNGHPYAKAAVDTLLSVDRLEGMVTFSIYEGPEVRYGLVEYRGLRKTRDSTVRRELTFRPGGLYRRSEVIESQQRLYNTGLFHLVSLNLKNPNEELPRADFVLSVVERETRWLGVKTGIGQDEEFDLTLDVSAEWEHRNLWGTGRKIGFGGEARFQVLTDWDNLENSLVLGYTEPWFLGTRTPLTVEFYFDPGVKLKEFGYRIQKFGGRGDLSHEVGRSSIVRAEYAYEQVDIFDVEPRRVPQIKQEQGISIRRKLAISATRDTRDRVFAPMRGSLSQIQAGLVGGFLGGDNDFYRLVCSWSRYYPLRRPVILASRVKVEVVEGFGTTPTVPSFDRVYAGGATSVRGYGERDLGPREYDGTPRGGEVLLLGNMEMRFPILWKFWGTAFTDVGQVWLETSDVDPDELRLTVGGGIQLLTPVGPLCLDYGRRILRHDDPPGGQLHLSVLYAF